MHKLLLTGFLLMLSVSTLSASIIASSQELNTTRPSSIELELISTPLQFKESVRAEGRFMTFLSKNPLTGDVGAPALPVVSEVVGIPAPTKPHVTFELAEPKVLPALSYPLEPIPSYNSTIDTTLIRLPENGFVPTYRKDEKLYSQDAWYPKQQVRVSEPMMMRGQSMVRVEFIPVQVNLATGELRWLEKAKIKLSWANHELKAPVTPVTDPYFESIFAGSLSNYEMARYWRQPHQPVTHSQDSVGGETRWLITLEGKGLFKISLADLASAGVDISNPDRLRVFHGSGEKAVEQAIWLDAEYLYLINTRDHGYWSKKIVYNLTVLENGTGLRMANLPAPPTQPTTISTVPYDLRFEEDHIYGSLNSSAREGEHWFWKLLSVSPSVMSDTFTYTFDLPHLSPLSAALVTSELGPEQSLNPGCYEVNLSVNNQEVSQQWQNNNTPFTELITVPNTDISATNNIYHIEQTECDGASRLHLNAFTVSYNRELVVDNDQLSFMNHAENAFNYRLSGFSISNIVAFETSSLNEPLRLTEPVVDNNGSYSFTFGRPAMSGETYLVTTLEQAQVVDSITLYQEKGLRHDLSQTNYDYLIITHPEFATAMESLLEWRQSQGYTARIVSADEIYNEFGNGTTDPQAIRDLIEYAYQSWQEPALSFIVLVGDSTYDPFDIYEIGDQIWLPSLFVYKDLYLGNVPADHAFVTGLEVNDSPDDLMPDAYIGRLPANSAEEAAAMAQKIVNYESNPSQLNDWRRKVLFVADNPDEAGDFYYYSDHLQNPLNLIPENTLLEKAYFLQANTPYQTSDAVRDKIAEEMNNSGLLILQYVGHSGRTQWAGHGGVWSMSSNDMQLLQPSDRLPFSLPWTCLEGFFMTPGSQSVAESMITPSDRGVIGSFSPIGLDVATGHDYMAQGFYQALFANNGSHEPETQLGPLTISAKMELPSSYERMWYTYMLFGDPALKLDVAPCLLDDSIDCAEEPEVTATPTFTPTFTPTSTPTSSLFMLHLPLITQNSTSR